LAITVYVSAETYSADLSMDSSLAAAVL